MICVYCMEYKKARVDSKLLDPATNVFFSSCELTGVVFVLVEVKMKVAPFLWPTV